MGNNHPSNLNRTSYYSVEYLNGNNNNNINNISNNNLNINQTTNNDRYLNESVDSEENEMNQIEEVNINNQNEYGLSSDQQNTTIDEEEEEEDQIDDDDDDDDDDKNSSNDYVIEDEDTNKSGTTTTTANTSTNTNSNSNNYQEDEYEEENSNTNNNTNSSGYYESLDFYESKPLQKAKIEQEDGEDEDEDLTCVTNNISNQNQKMKSYARPENRVLPNELPSKPLRETNLLKMDGFKRTWRNNNKQPNQSKTTTLRKKSNSILIGSNLLNLDEFQHDHIRPSLIKSLLNKSNSVSNLNNVNKSNSKNTSTIDLTKKTQEIEEEGLKKIKLTPPKYSIDELNNINNMKHIQSYLDKYSRSMNNVNQDEWFSLDLENKDNILNKSTNINEKSTIKKESNNKFKYPKLSSWSLTKKKDPNNNNIVANSSSTSNNNKLKTSKSFLNNIKLKDNSNSRKKSSTLDNQKLDYDFEAIPSKLIINSVIETPPPTPPPPPSYPPPPSSHQRKNKKNDKKSTNCNKNILPPSTQPPPPPLPSTQPPTSSSLQSTTNKLVSRIKSIHRPSFKKNNNNIDKMGNINNLSINNNKTSQQDIQIISRFPINSKIYRHYIAGGTANNSNILKQDKLTSCIDISNLMNSKLVLHPPSQPPPPPVKPAPALPPDCFYDSIEDEYHNQTNSRFIKNYPSSTTTSSDEDQSNKNITNLMNSSDSQSSSSPISTSNSIVFIRTNNNQNISSDYYLKSITNNCDQQRFITTQINKPEETRSTNRVCKVVNKTKLRSSSSSNKNSSNRSSVISSISSNETSSLGLSMDSSGHNSAASNTKTNNYDLLSDSTTSSSRKKPPIVNKNGSFVNMNNNQSKRLNEKFQDEIEKAYNERIKKRSSSSSAAPNFRWSRKEANNFGKQNSSNKLFKSQEVLLEEVEEKKTPQPIKSKIINQEKEQKQQKSNQFLPIRPASSLSSNINQDFKQSRQSAFVQLNNKYDSNNNELVPINNKTKSPIKLNEPVSSKSKEEITKNNEVIKAFINSHNKSSHIRTSLSSSSSSSNQNSNFILKPASQTSNSKTCSNGNNNSRYIETSRNNTSNVTNNGGGARSVSRSRRKGLEEIFPDIKIHKNQQQNSYVNIPVKTVKTVK
jgi:hypothetical protein